MQQQSSYIEVSEGGSGHAKLRSFQVTAGLSNRALMYSTSLFPKTRHAIDLVNQGLACIQYLPEATQHKSLHSSCSAVLNINVQRQLHMATGHQPAHSSVAQLVIVINNNIWIDTRNTGASKPLLELHTYSNTVDATH